MQPKTGRARNALFPPQVILDGEGHMAKPVSTTIFLLALAVLVTLAPARPARQASEAAQIAELKKQVEALELRVDRLAEELRRVTVRIPEGFPELKQLPKGWQKRWFNGMPYYIIPIDVNVEKKSEKK
jgi:hypothetical protein